MTLPRERYQAVNNVRAFLRSLLMPSLTPKVPRWIRREARWKLKHYPLEMYMEEVAKCPNCSKWFENENNNERKEK